MEEKQSKRATARLSLAAQADFAYLIRLATGKIKMSSDPVKQKMVLDMMKETVKNYAVQK